MYRQRLREHFICIVGLFVFSWIWVGGILDGFVGHPYGDLADHVWGNDWFARQLSDGVFPFWVESNYLPTPKVLWHIDPLGGLFHRIFLILPVQWSWNLLIIWRLFLGASILYGFSYSIHRSRMVSFLLGLMLVTSSYVSGLIHSGLSEYLGLGWGIASLWALYEKRWKSAGLLLGVSGWQAFSYGLIGGLFFLLLGWKEYRRLWVSYVIALAVIAPALWIGWQTLHHPSAAFSTMSAPGWNFRSLPTVDVLGWLRTGDWVHPNTPKLGNPGILQVHYIGWVITLSSIWGCWKITEMRVWYKRLLGVLFFSMGPKLSIARVVPFQGYFFLPLALFYLPYSPFSMVHHPYRMTAFLLPLLLIAIGFLFVKIPRWLQILLVLFYVGEQIVSPVPYPFIRTQITEDISVEGSRLDWPPDFSTANRKYLLMQTKHGEPIVYGVNRWLPAEIQQDPGVQRWLRLLDDPITRSRNRDMMPLPNILLPPSQKRSALPDLHIDWIIVHLDFLSRSEQEKILSQLKKEWGEPITTSKTQVVFSLTD